MEIEEAIELIKKEYEGAPDESEVADWLFENFTDVTGLPTVDRFAEQDHDHNVLAVFEQMCPDGDLDQEWHSLSEGCGCCWDCGEDADTCECTED